VLRLVVGSGSLVIHLPVHSTVSTLPNPTAACLFATGWPLLATVGRPLHFPIFVWSSFFCISALPSHHLFWSLSKHRPSIIPPNFSHSFLNSCHIIIIPPRLPVQKPFSYLATASLASQHLLVTHISDRTRGTQDHQHTPVASLPFLASNNLPYRLFGSATLGRRWMQISCCLRGNRSSRLALQG